MRLACGILALAAGALLAAAPGSRASAPAAASDAAHGGAAPATAEPEATAPERPAPERHPPEALLETIAKAAGGRKAVAGLLGLQLRGKILPLVDGPSATVRCELALSGLLREETRDAVGGVVRFLEGYLGWVDANGKRARPLDPKRARDLRYRFHELAAPIELPRTPSDSLADLGETPEGWMRLARRFGEESLAYDVDASTGRLRRVTRLGESETLSIELDDYRPADGFTYPFRWTAFVDGVATKETVLERVTRIDDPRPADFLPPGARRGL
jgi:hypothetical protein